MLYKTAITRKPGHNIGDGNTTAKLGKPDYAKALQQHNAYAEALCACGLEVIVLEPDPLFPDGCFVEDTAVVTPQMAHITNPGAASRKGETEVISGILLRSKPLFRIKLPGTMDGGDVLRVEEKFFVGLSDRTNEEGIRQFQEFVRPFGYTVTPVPLDNLLHLKSGIAYIGNNTLIAVSDLAKREEFASLNVIEVERGEEYAANCIRIDTKKLIFPKGYPLIKERMRRLGYETIELDMTEFQKMDGGLTCLSLLL